MKDMVYSQREIASQRKRIQDYKDANDRDEYDVKKQEEVLGEYFSGAKDEIQRCHEYRAALKEFIVRSRPAHRPVRTLPSEDAESRRAHVCRRRSSARRLTRRPRWRRLRKRSRSRLMPSSATRAWRRANCRRRLMAVSFE
jgi:hypothetical protein